MKKLRLVGAQVLTEGVREFTFDTASGESLSTWSAGAHVAFDTSAGARSYSLIRWPGEQPDVCRVAVQREEDGSQGSIAMHALGVGDEVTVAPPKNDFELVDQSRPVLLLAGGIGITPLISMATQLSEEGRDFALHYAGRNAPRMAYRDALQDAFGAALTLHFDDDVPLDLTGLMADHRDHAVYICGPQGMIEAARTAAEGAGILPEHIHVELFTTAAPEAGDQPFEVEIASSGQVINVAADQTIVDALEAAGVDVMYDCQRGDCGICQTDVISGTPDHRDVVLSEAERASGKIMQICVSRALSSRLVLDL